MLLRGNLLMAYMVSATRQGLVFERTSKSAKYASFANTDELFGQLDQLARAKKGAFRDISCSEEPVPEVVQGDISLQVSAQPDRVQRLVEYSLIIGFAGIGLSYLL